MEYNITFMLGFKYEVLKDSQSSKTLIWVENGLKFWCCKLYKLWN